MYHNKILAGQRLRNLEDNEIVRKGKANKGIVGKNRTGVVLDNEMFSKHILTLGSIGSGKSNLMYHICNAVLKDLSEDDLVIFFDAKGDYIKEFYRENDIVIGNQKKFAEYKVSSWNIFEDILAVDDDEMEDIAREVVSGLFSKNIESNSGSSTFIMGARDIFTAIVVALVRDFKKGKREVWTNRKLKRFICQSDVTRIRSFISRYKDLAWATSYIMSDTSATTQSYLSQLYMNVQEILSGPFAMEGNFSINKAVQNRGGKSIFLEYDISNANTLKPVYTLLIDLAIKESLGKPKLGGNIYFILDEFPLIPKLQYMDNALNFGRSLGVKIIAGIQNVGQVENTYGSELAMSILSGFSTFFSFKLFDEKSRRIISERHGKNSMKVSFVSTNSNKGVNDVIEYRSVIEDWDITQLNVGQCIVSSLNEDPFFFYPLEYVGK